MKKFSTSFAGYDKEEVNRFVNDVTKNYESMLSRLKASDAELAQVKVELTKLQEKESTLNRALLVAEDASNQIRRVAKDESQSIIDDARKNASRIINDALIKAEKAEANAEELRHRIDIYKRRVKQVINEQEEMIDDIDKIEY
jgi:cell division initiation protein